MIVIDNKEKDPFRLYVIVIAVLMAVVFFAQIIIKNN